MGSSPGWSARPEIQIKQLGLIACCCAVLRPNRWLHASRLSGNGQRTRVRFPPAPPITKPSCSQLGKLSYCAGSRVLLGFLRKPADFASQTNSPFRAHIPLSWPFPRSDLAPGTGPKSAKAATQAHTDQRVTRADRSSGWIAALATGWASVLAQSQQRLTVLFGSGQTVFCAASLAAASCAGASGSDLPRHDLRRGGWTADVIVVVENPSLMA